MENEVFFDIGANNGLVAIILAKQNPKSKIVVVEPISELCDIIRKNASDNNLGNIVILQKAFHTDLGGTKLFIATSCSGASTTNVRDESAFIALEKSAEYRDVETVTFDYLCDHFVSESQVIKLLKIDCEGGEYSLMDSPQFKQGRVEYLEGEFHDTAYGSSASMSASGLFEYCKNFVLREMRVTRLTRMLDVLREDILSFQRTS
jgi:FkbM family methyltransferase